MDWLVSETCTNLLCLLSRGLCVALVFSIRKLATDLTLEEGQREDRFHVSFAAAKPGSFILLPAFRGGPLGRVGCSQISAHIRRGGGARGVRFRFGWEIGTVPEGCLKATRLYQFPSPETRRGREPGQTDRIRL